MRILYSTLLITFVLGVFTPLTSSAAVDDHEVKEWIFLGLTSKRHRYSEKMDESIAKTYSVRRLEGGWRLLKSLRNSGDSDNLSLDAAEHYLFMRFCASKSGDTGYRELPPWYETARRFAVKHDLEKYIANNDQPISTPDSKITSWGNKGVEVGLSDYKKREKREPSNKTSDIKTLMGFSYLQYYY